MDKEELKRASDKAMETFKLPSGWMINAMRACNRKFTPNKKRLSDKQRGKLQVEKKKGGMK